MIKPIHFIIVIIMAVLFLILLVFGINTNISVVNQQRDVSVLNQKFSTVMDLDGKFTQQKKELQEVVATQINQGVQSMQSKLDAADAVNKGLVAQVQKYETRIKTLEMQIAQYRTAQTITEHRVDVLQERIQP